MAVASLLSRFSLIPPLAHPFHRAVSTQSKLISALEQPWRVKSVAAVAVGPASFSLVRFIVTGGGTEAISVPRSVPVLVAHELLQAGHRCLDVRTVDEFNAGHVVGAMNIPYMFKAGSGLAKNPEFLKDVSSMFKTDDEIIVGCQSGRRSLMATADLSSAVSCG
ncbi:Thiosulfate sulfurtransferase protein [Dioscorea alata]|uniref:Thiosulfate sulfurtransferase protein n=1 Tax=Dioscorea alata TaxID=55571 RepID=A0ACB7V6C3_DIOAL|nr:Thiosulfate sulfurtransferase protein [Dioscorea alata]